MLAEVLTVALDTLPFLVVETLLALGCGGAASGTVRGAICARY
jgi:hypothetical protein